MKIKVFKIIGRILLILLILIVVIVIAALLFLTFYPGVGKTPDKKAQKTFAEKSDNFYDGAFHNENESGLMTGARDEHSDRNTPENLLPAVKLTNIRRANAGQLKVAWLGHSSSFLQMGDQNILIDPVLSERTSPVSFIGPKRFAETALTTGDVPETDVVFISHDHYDHLDYPTITAIDSKVKHYIVPLGVDSILLGWDVDKDKIHTLCWWESVTLDGVTYTLTPSRHFTGRNPLKRNVTLWGGLYLCDGAHSVYYTADGGYYDVFGTIREKLGEPDLMLTENGQYDNGWKNVHMTPEQSVQAVSDMHAKWAIPVHWGAFSICNHAWDDPIIRFTAAAKKQSINIASPKIGELIDYDDLGSHQERWWESCE